MASPPCCSCLPLWLWGGIWEFDQHFHTHATSPMHACIPTLISLSIFVYDRYIDYKSSAPRKREQTSSRCLPQA